MTKQAEGSFFRFDSKSEITWMQDKEQATHLRITNTLYFFREILTVSL